MRQRGPVAWLLAATVAATHAAPHPGGVLVVASGEKEILAMPTTAPHLAEPVLGVTVEVSIEDGFRIYRASHESRTYTVRSLIDGPPRRFALIPGRGGSRNWRHWSGYD